jgi:GNAT superfamily N-acetyltransferase
MADPEIEIVEITGAKPDDDLLRVVYDEVLLPSFPPGELDSVEALIGALRGSSGDVVLVAIDGDTPQGAVVYHLMPELRIGLLSYAASRPGQRGRGLGGLLMRALRERWEVAPIDLAVGEVEDPRVYPDTDDNHPRSRLRFYGRHGADLLMVPWIQPALQGRERVPGMLLLRMWARQPAPASVPAVTLVRWAEAYFASEEGGVPTDSAFRALRKRLDAEPAVSVAPVMDFSKVPPLDPG